MLLAGELALGGEIAAGWVDIDGARSPASRTAPPHASPTSASTGSSLPGCATCRSTAARDTRSRAPAMRSTRSTRWRWRTA